jgi:hypothetical protein
VLCVDGNFQNKPKKILNSEKSVPKIGWQGLEI